MLAIDENWVDGEEQEADSEWFGEPDNMAKSFLGFARNDPSVPSERLLLESAHYIPLLAGPFCKGAFVDIIHFSSRQIVARACIQERRYFDTARMDSCLR